MSSNPGTSLSELAPQLDGINPSLTRYGRSEPAPVLPLREEPDLLSWLETSGRLVADEETAAADVSTVEEEELSALMGEKEDYNAADEATEEDWED
jgi:transposase-like protein